MEVVNLPKVIQVCELCNVQLYPMLELKWKIGGTKLNWKSNQNRRSIFIFTRVLKLFYLASISSIHRLIYSYMLYTITTKYSRKLQANIIIQHGRKKKKNKPKRWEKKSRKYIQKVMIRETFTCKSFSKITLVKIFIRFCIRWRHRRQAKRSQNF